MSVQTPISARCKSASADFARDLQSTNHFNATQNDWIFKKLRKQKSNQNAALRTQIATGNGNFDCRGAHANIALLLLTGTMRGSGLLIGERARNNKCADTEFRPNKEIDSLQNAHRLENLEHPDGQILDQ